MLIVFDLDFTLWDCGGVWCDFTNPPYRRYNGYVVDSANRTIILYPEVIELLSFLHSKNIFVALASRTSEPSWANNLLHLFGINHYFKYKEIYPSSKTVHFRRLQKQTGINFNNMYFFDDEYRNIEEVSMLGVNCLHVKDGISRNTVLNFIQYS